MSGSSGLKEFWPDFQRYTQLLLTIVGEYATLPSTPQKLASD